MCNMNSLIAPVVFWILSPSFIFAFSLHLLLFITREYTIINANLKLINAKIHLFHSIDIH